MSRRIGATTAERSVPTLTRKRRKASPQAQQASPQSAQATSRSGGGRGGVQGVNLIILILVAAAVTIAAGLLAKTVNTARSIDGKAKSISATGGTINASTDSISQLEQTNTIARSILKSASPLDGVLTKIVARASSINRDASSIDRLASTINSTAGTINTTASSIGGSAGSINSVAGSINSTAGDINDTARAIDSIAGGIDSVAKTINGTARSINTTVGPGAGILGVARLIDDDAANINATADKTIAIASSIKVDTGNILGNAVAALDTAACIDEKLPGSNKPPNQCEGKP
jgi:methyl-accepting chemotaxis protein